MIDTHAAVLARAVELKEENEDLQAEIERLRSRIEGTLSLLEDSDADDCDIYRLSCALQGKVW